MFLPTQLKFWCKIWKSSNTIHEKQITFTEQNQTGNHFLKKVVFSEIQFEIDGFTFPDSTEHPMPINWKHSWKKVNFYCMTQKDISWTGCASAKKMISHLPTQHFCRIQKTIFENNLTLASLCWKASSFPKKSFFQGSVSSKIVYTSKLISKFDAMVWVSVKTICYELFLRRIKLRKKDFWKFQIVFSLLRKRSLSEKLCFQKVSTKDGVSIAGRQKSRKIASFSANSRQQ